VHRRLLSRPLLVALTAGTLLTACGSAAHHTRIAAAPRPLPSPAAQVPPAGPGAPSAAALPPARSPAAVKSTAQRVTAAVRGATTDPQVQLDVAVVDTGTGMSVHVGAGTPVRAASLTKLVIYLAGSGRGRDLGAAAMIERSDNDAATGCGTQLAATRRCSRCSTRPGWTTPLRFRRCCCPGTAG